MSLLLGVWFSWEVEAERSMGRKRKAGGFFLFFFFSITRFRRRSKMGKEGSSSIDCSFSWAVILYMCLV